MPWRSAKRRGGGGEKGARMGGKQRNMASRCKNKQVAVRVGGSGRANLERASERAGAAARGVGAEPGRAAPGDAAVAARGDALPGHGHLDEPHAGRELPQHEAPLVAAPAASPTAGLLQHGEAHPAGRVHALDGAVLQLPAPRRGPELLDDVLRRRRDLHVRRAVILSEANARIYAGCGWDRRRKVLECWRGGCGCGARTYVRGVEGAGGGARGRAGRRARRGARAGRRPVGRRPLPRHRRGGAPTGAAPRGGPSAGAPRPPPRSRAPPPAAPAPPSTSSRYGRPACSFRVRLPCRAARVCCCCSRQLSCCFFSL
jgi:hypothetical protein